MGGAHGFSLKTRSQLKVAQMRPLTLPCLSVRLSEVNNSRTVERIFIKFYIRDF
jgi:hypothetical protein